MNLLVHSATRQDEKLSLWTSIPLARVNNAAFLSSLDIISATPIKWLYIHAVTFLFSYKPSLSCLCWFTYWEKHMGGLPAIDFNGGTSFYKSTYGIYMYHVFEYVKCNKYNWIWFWCFWNRLHVLSTLNDFCALHGNKSLRCHTVPHNWAYM